MPYVKHKTYYWFGFTCEILRVWIFPPTSLSIAEEVLHAVPGLVVEVTVILCTSNSRVAVSSSDRSTFV